MSSGGGRSVKIWRLQIYLSAPIRSDAQWRRIRELLPEVTAFGTEVSHQRHFLRLSQEAESRTDAITDARARVVTALGADAIDGIGGEDDLMQEREVLLWVRATRRQVRRWERLLAINVQAGFAGRHTEPSQIWDAQIEKHLALVTANNLLRAVAHADERFTLMTRTMAADIRNQRDLHEHWDEQMASFYNTQNPGPLTRGGLTFADRHPGNSPFDFLGWNSKAGPRLGPGILVADLHAYVDQIEAEVLAVAPHLSRFVTNDNDSPWLGEPPEEWWPRPDAEGPG